MNERFIIDDEGTLVDTVTKDTYKNVSDVCELLNGLHEINLQLNSELKIIKYKRGKQ